MAAQTVLMGEGKRCDTSIALQCPDRRSMVRFARSSCLSLSVIANFRPLYRSLYSVILSTDCWFAFVRTCESTQAV